jgi:hypothetical protein
LLEINTDATQLSLKRHLLAVMHMPSLSFGACA